ncbi:MAG: efflux RND transporter periplasmic adaptor subunit [Planctomycetota bacterium]|nr:efflux RND transporter periplasmic adaptor subunit [Planctomycetota bacterium]
MNDKRKWIGMLALLLLAFGAGFALRGGKSAQVGESSQEGAKAQTAWTCSMHPQVRLPNPGKCPICEMPLIQADASGGGTGDPKLELSEHARAMASVQTAHVVKRKLFKEIRAVGMIQFNETALATVTTRVDGYVERLFVDYTGMAVEKGDHLVEIYSPDLVIAQKELLLAVETPDNARLVEAARLKLRRWEITDAQIEELLKTRKIEERMTIYSPVKGTVVEKMVVEKSSVKAGDALYRLANLESLWVHLDIYEFEYAWVQYGQLVEIAAEAYPGESFKGMVTFISPTLNESTRTIRVRVNVTNTDGRLKPGMFVSARIRVPLLSDGHAAPTGVEGRFNCPMHPEVLKDGPGKCDLCGMDLKQVSSAHGRHPGERYTCPMHPEVMQDQPGNCPKCGMKLEKDVHQETWICEMCPHVKSDKPGNCPDCGMKLSKAPQTSGEILAVPLAAVLDSGLNKLVYVERVKGEFEPVQVTLGPRASVSEGGQTKEFYPVLSGLKEHDAVAVRGNFLIDSQVQIRGMQSLLFPKGGPGAAGTTMAVTVERRRPKRPCPRGTNIEQGKSKVNGIGSP